MLYAVELKSNAVCCGAGVVSCMLWSYRCMLYAVELKSLAVCCGAEVIIWTSSVVIIHCAYGWVSMPLQVHHVRQAGIRLKCIFVVYGAQRVSLV